MTETMHSTDELSLLKERYETLKGNSNITVSQELIGKQIEQERLQIHLGEKNLEKVTLKAETKAYASSTIYGISSIQELIPHVTEEIEGIGARFRKGQAGVAFKEIQEYISDIEPLIAAGITCKMVFDKVFSIKDADDNLLVNIYDSVGKAVMQECQMRYYERKAPGLLHVLKKNYWHKAIGTQQKLTDIQIMMNRNDVHWTPWPRPVRVKLGNVLVDCLLRKSGWFEPFIQRVGRKSQTFLVPTARFNDIKDNIIDQARLFSAEHWPMLIEPRDWTQSSNGGYLLDEVMRGHDMVRKGNPDRIQGENPVAFLNRVQKVGYRINPFIADVAETLYKMGRTVGKNPKFIPSTATLDLPPKPVDIDTNAKARKEWCIAAAKIHNKNNELVRKSCRTRMTMKAVERFKDIEVFYCPWSFDYRGRAYPIPAYLTPQDTDFGKSLLRFSQESMMTFEGEDWLRFQVATTYGLDKKTMKERIDWTWDNESLITSIVLDPIGNLHEWEVADEPFQFLAACEEYYYCIISGERNYTGLPIATDATCSGMQILAGLGRCKSTAELTNVLPSDSPQDAYRAVAEKAMPNIPEQWREHVDRSVAKRLVMTIPYNAKFKSNWGYVKEALTDKEKGKGLEVSNADITLITHALRDAVFELFKGPVKVMEWIEKEVGIALKSGKTELEWTTPSGFNVCQKIMKPEITTMDTQLLGKVRRVFIAIGDSDKVNVSKHKAATSPNLIHSLDASLLHLSVLRFDAPIALIHDSVLCRATDMSLLSTVVRETYMHLFAENDYLKSFAHQIGAETEPPIIGDLEPSSVIDSTYFFC
jgi:DNA-directed RNA polymerase